MLSKRSVSTEDGREKCQRKERFSGIMCARDVENY